MAGFGDFRAAFYPELADPGVRNGLFSLTNAEVGGQGPLAQQAFMESVLNRASARGKSLADTIYDRNYYPATTFGRMGGRLPEQTAGVYGSLLNDVMGGSNVAAYGTGNASGTVGFAGGPQTAAYGGERYGIEGKDRDWARRAAQLPNEGLNDVGPNGLQPLHPEIYASTAQSSPSPSAPVTTGSLPGQRPMDTPSLATPPPGLLSRLGIEKPGFVSDLQTGLNSPLAQQGIGLLLAGLTGRDPNAGMSAGAQRANMATMDLIHRMEADRARKLFPLQVEQARAGLAQTNAALERGRQMLPLDVEQAKNAIAKQNLDIAQAKSTFTHIGTDAMGLPIYGFVDPITKQVTPAQAPGGQAQGTNTIDPNLSGEDLLGAIAKHPQYGPGIANHVRGIAEGRENMPTGMGAKSPFGLLLQRFVNQYDPSLDATTIARRKTFNQQLGSAAPSSVGGQKTLMGTSLGHLAEVAEAAGTMGNVDPIGWAPAAHAANAAKNTTTANAAKANALAERVDRFAGEVGKLYSGSQGGGVQEREQTRSRFSANMTPAEMAASLEASKGLIISKLSALETQQDEIFGANAKGRIDFLGKSGRDAIDKIDATIAKLRGGKAPHPTTQQPAAAAAPIPKTGDVVDGYRFKGGNPADPANWERATVPRFAPAGAF